MFSKKVKCIKCKSGIKEDFDFCPHCGCDMRNPEKDIRDYGLLGRNEKVESAPSIGGNSFGVNDGMVNSIFNQLMKAFEAQMKQGLEAGDEGGRGIQIKIGMPQQQKQTRGPKKRVITNDQVKRMAGMPRVEAKTDIRRLSDKVVYELKAPDVGSVEDVFVSKVESGYEVKAIGKNRVYINSVPVDLPLKSYSLSDKGLIFEFGLEN